MKKLNEFLAEANALITEKFKKDDIVTISTKSKSGKKYDGKTGLVMRVNDNGSSPTTYIVKIPNARSPEVEFFEKELTLVKENLNEGKMKFTLDMMGDDRELDKLEKKVKKYTTSLNRTEGRFSDEEWSIVTKDRKSADMVINALYGDDDGSRDTNAFYLGLSEAKQINEVKRKAVQRKPSERQFRDSGEATDFIENILDMIADPRLTNYIKEFADFTGDSKMLQHLNNARKSYDKFYDRFGQEF